MRLHGYFITFALLITAVFSGAFRQSEQTRDSPADHLKKLQGTWIHEEDSLAVITVTGNVFTFLYSGTKVTDEDKYTIKVIDSLPEYSVAKDNFLVLTNKFDSLHYEILGLGENALSLSHFPSGVRHLYIRKR